MASYDPFAPGLIKLEDPENGEKSHVSSVARPAVLPQTLLLSKRAKSAVNWAVRKSTEPAAVRPEYPGAEKALGANASRGDQCSC